MPEAMARMRTVNSASMPTLSVIIPNYNHGRYLRSSLGAILGQSVPPMEVLVYDDGSTDDSVSVVREIAGKNRVVRLIADTKKAGPNANLNRGLRAARGDFVYLAAADDYVLPGFFEKSLSLLAENSQARICITDLAQFDAFTGRVRYLRPRLSSVAEYVSPGRIATILSRRHLYMYGGMTMFSRATLLEFGGYPADLKWYADWFSVLVLSLRYGACYIPEALPTMRMLPDSFSAAGAKDLAAQRALFRRIIQLLRTDRNADVWAPIFKSGGLCLLGSQVLRVLAEAEYRDIITLRLLARLLVNIPVTVAGLNPATPSPFKVLDKTVRSTLGLDDYIDQCGLLLDSPNAG
jgi:glycosyltransferase involved in cell wall biosynthesis